MEIALTKVLGRSGNNLGIFSFALCCIKPTITASSLLFHDGKKEMLTDRRLQ